MSFAGRELRRNFAQLNAGIRRGKNLEKDGSRVPYWEALLMVLFQKGKAGPCMTKPRLWEKLHLSQWGRVKALAGHVGFKVQRLKVDQCRLLMQNVEVKDTF